MTGRAQPYGLRPLLRASCRFVLAVCLSALCQSLFACEAETNGWGDEGRYAEAEFSNARGSSGQHESWVPHDAQLTLHAGFTRETDEYGHRVLGHVRDAKILTIHVRRPGDDRITCPTGVVLPQGQVFEDIAPRLVDLDGDGMPEIIVVQSEQSRGARLAVFDRRARLLAVTSYIGRTHRWLAPIGAADLDGDGNIEIAYIDRPHLAKTLRIWRFEKGTLTEIASKPGLSNHKIGWAHIPGGIRNCGDGPQFITANHNWTRIMASSLDGGAIQSRDIGPYAGPDSLNHATDCP